MLMATPVKKAVIYRMVMKDHICPFGLKSLDLLQREGYQVEDHWLRTREETVRFQADQGVDTTPQTFIDGRRVGGYDDLRGFFGDPLQDPDATSYVPVVAVFAMTALMATTAGYAAGTLVSFRTVEWFVAFSMCVLAALKLRDLESSRTCSSATTSWLGAGFAMPISAPTLCTLLWLAYPLRRQTEPD